MAGSERLGEGAVDWRLDYVLLLVSSYEVDQVFDLDRLDLNLAQLVSHSHQQPHESEYLPSCSFEHNDDLKVHLLRFVSVMLALSTQSLHRKTFGTGSECLIG